MRTISYLFLYIVINVVIQALPAYAQSVEDFFHQAAHLYIDGKTRDAQNTIQSALQRYPNDPKLRTLLGKIRDEEKQQNQNQQQNDQQQDQQQQDQQQQDQQQQDQQQDDKKQSEEQKEQQSQAGEKQQELSKEDAERLLEALKNQEKEAQKAKQKPARGRVRVEKDW